MFRDVACVRTVHKTSIKLNKQNDDPQNYIYIAFLFDKSQSK